MNIGFIGLGKLGAPVVEAIREHGHSVVGYDINGSGADSIENCVKDSEIVFVAVPTPHDPAYDGKYVCSDLEPKDFDYTIARDVLIEADKHMIKDQLLVLISTVLPGTTREHFEPNVNNATFIYNPYLIAMGTVKRDFLNPEMIMMGSKDERAMYRLEEFYRQMCSCDRYIRGTYEECEAIKIFYNTFITTKITLVNMIQDVAMKLGNMNVDVVTDALAHSTERIMSPRYMTAGMGDGGSCHPRDNIALRYMAQELKLGYDIFDTIIKAREEQARNMANFLKDLSLENNLPIIIVGKGFKPDVPYEDGSSSILVAQFCDCTFDDFSKPAVFLLAHSRKITYGGINDDYNFPEGSIIVDPWRERKDAIHYGDTTLQY